MRVPQESILRTESPRGFRLIEIVNSQPLEVRRLAIGTLEKAQNSHPRIIEMVKDDPYSFIQDVRQTMQRALDIAPSSRGDQAPSQDILDLLDDFRRALGSPPSEDGQPANRRAQTVVVSTNSHSREVRDSSPDSAWNIARDNSQGFILEMRTLAARNTRDITNASSERRNTESHSSLSRTPAGIDPDVFANLPNHIRAELHALIPSAAEPSSQPPQGTPATGGQSAPQGTRPPTETTSASSSSQVPAEDRVEEVSWPRISEWLQSRTGLKPRVRCVWCLEEILISDGDLQPENGEREPSFQLPCSHIVGQRCLRNSLELYGVRVTRCPYCRAEIGNVYG